MRRHLTLLVIAACHGCGAPGNAPVPDADAAETGAGARQMTGNLDSIVAAALEDAAGRTGLSADALVVLQAEAVVWRDGSLGCPEPGMAYTQALVPGFRVRIRAGEEVLDYHASRHGRVTLCPRGRAQGPAPPDDAV
jgi:hypothetical protein